MSGHAAGRTVGGRSGRAIVASLVTVGLLAAAPRALAQESACELGLVLSGGGARGVAHLGVLEVLEENGVRPDCIAGASMGSVIGSLYASGHSLPQIESMLASLSWRSLYVESHNRSQQGILHRIEQQRTGLRLGISGGGLRTPRGLLSDALVNRLLIEHLAPANFAAGRSFDALPIPFRTVGTDLRTGDRVVLDRGDLARAVRSSMSVPLAYPAVVWDQAILVDGGLVDNLPVSLAEDMGASFVVAVDVQTPLEEDLVPDLLGVTQRIVDLLFAAKNQQYARRPHLTITPDLGEHSFADYSGFDQLIAAGREAAEAALAQIPAQYRGRALPSRVPPEPHVFGPRTIRDIVVTGNRYLSERTILLEFGPRVGDIIDWRRLLTDLEHFYTARLVQSAWLDLEPVGEDGIRIFLHVQEEYRTTADIGLAYQSADQVQGMLRLETRDLLGSGERLQLSAAASSKGRMLGLRLSGEQLFGAHLGYQVDLQAQIERPKVYEMGALVTRAEFDRRDLQLGANLPFGRNHALQLGYRFGDVTVVERLGLPDPAAVDQQRVLVGRYLWDNLNSLSLPLQGRRYRITAERNTGDHRYWRLALEGHAVQRIGAMVFEGRAVYGYSSDPLPVYEQFRVGGPELLPGLARDELWGDQLLAISAQFGYDPLSLVRVYARVGVGGVWDRQEEINFGDARVGVGVGATVATPFGPIQLDYGWADEQSRRLYFSIGWQ